MRIDLVSLLAIPLVAHAQLQYIVPQALTVVPGRYIVKVSQVQTLNLALSILPKPPIYTYNFGTFYGFTADISIGLLAVLQKLPGILQIEQDAPVKILDYDVNLQKRAWIQQATSAGTWGLARISHQVNTSKSYTYDSTAGAGACAYIIDTGISTAHPEFEGRATFLANFAGDALNDDGNGHGTHCAGTIGSKTYGVAKKAKLFGVKVLGISGAGTNSAVIAGINYVVNDTKNRAAACPNGAVVSMSLGGQTSPSVNSAAAQAVKAGLFMAVAAGNDAVDASNVSPGSEPSVFTVAAMDTTDTFATQFSNFGPLVDILAPGVGILSTWLLNKTNTLSGTSMATPHVAGLATYLLGLKAKQTPAQLSAQIQGYALKGKVKSVPSNTTNLLANNGNGLV